MIIAVTPDELEQIVYIADSPAEMAKLTGVKRTAIWQGITRGYKNKKHKSKLGYRFYRVQEEET